MLTVADERFQLLESHPQALELRDLVLHGAPQAARPSMTRRGLFAPEGAKLPARDAPNSPLPPAHRGDSRPDRAYHTPVAALVIPPKRLMSNAIRNCPLCAT